MMPELNLPFPDPKGLSATTKEWIKAQGLQPFADYFFSVTNGKRDTKRRLQGLELAVRWCIAAENGLDGNRTPGPMADVIKAVLFPNAKWKNSENSAKIIEAWTEMCQRSAMYRFAKLDDSMFYPVVYACLRAAQGSWMSGIEPQDGLIESAIRKAFEKETGRALATNEAYGYVVQTNGLQSKIVLFTDPKVSWNELGDQLIRWVAS